MNSEHQTSQSRSRFVVFFALVLTTVNLLAIAVAWKSHGWGAVSIAYYVCPALNCVLALIALLAIPSLKRRDRTFSLAEHVAISVGMPAIAIVLDVILIFSF